MSSKRTPSFPTTAGSSRSRSTELSFRCRSTQCHAPGAAPAVWRSENGGSSWQRLARGFPKKQTYFTVLRDGVDFDKLKSPALYFGTTSGQLWLGRDAGEDWQCLFDSLPPINCVKVAVV